MKVPPNKELILNSLTAMAKDVGRPPTRREFIALSGISEHQISQFFPTWNDAVRAAGFRPYIVNVRLKDRQLLADWAYVVRRLGRIPARRAYHHLGQFDRRTFERRFGPWSKLPEVFRKFARGKPEWADVVALLPRPKRKRLPKRVATPTQNPLASAALHATSDPAFNKALTSVILPALSAVEGSEAKTSAPSRDSRAMNPGVTAPQWKTIPTASISAPQENTAPNRQSPAVPPSKRRFPPLRGRPTYGQPMDFRGLRHEPVNEQGVVLLFGLVASELGYIVESVQTGFPDCEAKRQIAPQRWQRVQLEFEFESRNYRDHGHPLNGCDVIVCWRHNWPDCPAHLEILELSSLLQSLAASPG